MTRYWVRAFLSGLALSAATAMLTVTASADKLFGAMEKAYVTNPTLNAARAGQRATDELVPQALSGWRPTISVFGEVSRTRSSKEGVPIITPDGPDVDSVAINNATSGNVSIQLSQPLFRGFGTVNQTKSAEARVDAGKQNLLATEQQVLFDVVQAYMDVYAGRQYVVLRRQDVSALEAQVKAARDRFAVGEITRTDVAQAQARLAESQSFLVNAQTDLARAVASYVQMVGQEPGKLSYPKVVSIPNSLKMALDVAGEINPQLLAQAFVEVARNSDISVAFSNLLPSADLVASAAGSDPDFAQSKDRSSAVQVGAQLTIPLYEAGAVYSQVRQAKQLASQSRIQVIEVARAVRQAVASSWNAYVGLAQIIKNTRTQVSAAQLALNGVQQEYQAGTRTTLDVLDAQRDLVQAQVLQVTAERNRVVSGYQLLAAIGHLTAVEVGLKVPIYDPDANYKRVRNKWIGTDVKTVE
ncbi:MAG: TolC family outer membrane protein [Aestuariivirga sp.]|uniref:TolC family outer membrane protein n=1 Tax=Aestuariivirga sp. TaxID=2650926 RepID=UPI003015F90F